MALTNNSTEVDSETLSNSAIFFSYYAAFVLRFIAGFATIMNLCVLLLLIRLKQKFRNYSYWFQILVLSSEDLFNGLSSLALTFFDYEIFRTSAIACGVILWAWACSQINTLLGICCICVIRFRSIQAIDRPQEPMFGYRQEISIVIAAFVSVLYSLIPYLIFPLNHHPVRPACTAPALFGPNTQAYKLMLAFGLLLPLVVINVLYSICLAKLRRIIARIRPFDEKGNSKNVTQDSKTEQTHDVTSGSADKPPKLKPKEVDFLVQATKASGHKGSLEKITIIQQLPAYPIKYCSTSTETNATGETGKTEGSTAIGVRASTKDAHSRAVKLLGIILLLTNVTVIIPVSLLIRDTIAPDLQTGNSASLGLIMLPLNSLVNAFVYGFFSVEIRTFIRTKLVDIWRLFRPWINTIE